MFFDWITTCLGDPDLIILRIISRLSPLSPFVYLLTHTRIHLYTAFKLYICRDDNIYCFIYRGGRVKNEMAPLSPMTMWLDDVTCSMKNTHLQDCKHGAWGRTDCGNDEAVAVECFSFAEGRRISLKEHFAIYK